MAAGKQAFTAGASTLANCASEGRYMPTCTQLLDEDKFIVETFYGRENNYECKATYFVADYLNIELSTAYKRKNLPLERLIILLFDKNKYLI